VALYLFVKDGNLFDPHGIWEIALDRYVFHKTYLFFNIDICKSRNKIRGVCYGVLRLHKVTKFAIFK